MTAYIPLTQLFKIIKVLPINILIQEKSLLDRGSLNFKMTHFDVTVDKIGPVLEPLRVVHTPCLKLNCAHYSNARKINH